ncbi:MAG: DUF3703 domain-containing protein [Oligoflexus sp.]|nr:DUF3703 domain-containing protein [Oligoflexus sp.]
MIQKNTIELHFNSELDKYFDARKRRDSPLAWSYLQRAHIFSQDFALLHNTIHIEMIRFAFAERKWAELWG